MFSWLPRWLQPRWYRVAHATFDPAWETILAADYAHWRLLDDGERERMRTLVARFVAGTRWEAARGFELDDRVRVLVAAQACLLLLGLDLDDYPDVSSVIVHPNTVRLHGEHRSPAGGRLMSSGPRFLAGQAHYRGPVVLSWAATRRGAARSDRGQNVVYHEFAHRLDMLDGVTDGTPPLDDGVAERWSRVFTPALERVRTDGSPVLRPYAATNPAEFFAVATETFFNQPDELEQHEPELFVELVRFYGQDPSARLARNRRPVLGDG